MYLILQLSPGRRRAVRAAQAEAIALLHSHRPSLPDGGPLGEVGGIFWLDLHDPTPRLAEQLPLLGYTSTVYRLEPIAASTHPPTRAGEHRLPTAVRWRGEWWSVGEIWRRDENEEREEAPDRGTFLLPGQTGEPREVRGYRGGRRGLPPADARLAVNLSLSEGSVRLLDPFAGAGGIVVAAIRHGLEVLSVDIDPFVRHGLVGLGARHCVADATALPLPDQSVDAIATEPPYLPEAMPVVIASLDEANRVVRPGGRICYFCSETQVESLVAATGAPLQLVRRFRIDRKGTPCAALVWKKI